MRISLIKERKIYRRIITIHRVISDPTGTSQDVYTRIEKSKKRFLPKFRKELLNSFERNRAKSLISINVPGDTEVSKVFDMLEQEYSILVDIPKTKYSSPMDLCVIPELEGLKRNDDAEMIASHIMGNVWRTVYSKLIDSISKIRIYCHPDIRNTLTSVLGFEELNDVLIKSLGRK